MNNVAITERMDGVRFTVRVVPRSSRSAIDGVHGSAIRVRLHAPPVDGAANDALIALLSKELGVAKRAVTIVSGTHARSKVIDVTGVCAADVRRTLEIP